MARITFEGKRYPLLAGEDALQALLRGGANIEVSCRKGTCQTCLLRAIEGDPGPEARRGLREELASRGYFMPCKAKLTADVVAARPNPKELTVRMHVHLKELIAPDVARILLEPETTFDWRPGQTINIHHPSGAIRRYSIASLALEDYYLELHIKRIPGGKVSTWLVDELREGAIIEVQGPQGNCVWDGGRLDEPLLLLATGTGLAPLIGLAREALAGGHRAPIYLYHGSRHFTGLYRHTELTELAKRHANFHYRPCLSGGDPPNQIRHGRVVDHARREHPSLDDHIIYLCGLPEMVHSARYWAISAGAKRSAIHADPFDVAVPYAPDDTAKLTSLAPDPEMWAALDSGAGLRAILTDFYNRAYADPRLSPFFHKVTIDRAIDKQYAFLADILAGKKDYFGLKPFNAHHWMVISDELFDYREQLIESCMRRHGLAEHLIRRWCALHELFRREIVKVAPRGLVVDGVEHRVETTTEERLDVGSLCDGCSAEMPVGSIARLNTRTGEIYCQDCTARNVGGTNRPPPLS